MDAWIALGWCAAWLGDGPALNQPRPVAAQPAPSIVIPAGHFDDVRQPDLAFVPPAPLPEFYFDQIPRLRFELSKPESCTDSIVCPPAPPAEKETSQRPMFRLDHDSRTDRTRLFPSEPLDTCAAESRADSARRIPAGSPEIFDQLHHLQSAIRHLEAAGRDQLAQSLRQEYRTSVAQLHHEIERAIERKQAEIERLWKEIDRLKSCLVTERGDAPSDRIRLADGSEDHAPMWVAAPEMPTEIPPSPAPIYLIPSPAAAGRPPLLFPTAPMRPVEVELGVPVPELPLEPSPVEEETSESDDDPVA
jgi:hypothetical protein